MKLRIIIIFYLLLSISAYSGIDDNKQIVPQSFDGLIHKIHIKDDDTDTIIFINTDSKRNISIKMQKNASIEFLDTEDFCAIDISVDTPFYQTSIAYIIYVVLFLGICGLIILYNIHKHKKERVFFDKQIVEKTKEISRQKEKIEKMIKVWLPASKNLKETEDIKNQTYNSATVIFADIEGFSTKINNVNAEELLLRLNTIFQSFDEIVKKYNITKIKTIGDAYMCVGGIETEDGTHTIKAILAAMEMQRFLDNQNKNFVIKLEMRIGIHTGQVVAGIVGKNKLEYDIWGETVNIANRMEAGSQVNKINVSYQTYEQSVNFFTFEDRGKIAVKIIGEKQMFFVLKIKNNLTADGINPNHDFNVKLQYLTYKILETKNITKLQEGLPSNLYYHNSRHTTDVIYSVEDIGKKEKISEEEMLLLKCAALFHDMGFLVSYDGHEEESVKIAQQQLKFYNFSDRQIQIVSRLIMATKSPVNPQNLLEKILCDADIYYIISSDFIPISQNLFQELVERNKINDFTQWYRMQYNFIKNHTYFTETAQKNNTQKEILLKKLEAII